MSKKRLLWVAAVAVIAVAGALWLWQSAKTQQASERVLAQEAILGRWAVIVPGAVSQPLLLDFPARGTPFCVYSKSLRAPVSFVIHQMPLRTRMLDIVRHRPMPPPVYVISIVGGPAANPGGQPWQGRLIGDGNVLILVPWSGIPTALRRLGSG